MASLMPDGGSTGDLRVIDSAASCPSGFTPLNWTAGTGWCRRCIGPRNAALRQQSMRIRSSPRPWSAPRARRLWGVEFGNASADVNVIASVPQGATGDGSDNANGWAGVVNNHESTPKLLYVWVICASV
jgi:hypothetical protein